jgi:hypothetical protein
LFDRSNSLAIQGWENNRNPWTASFGKNPGEKYQPQINEQKNLPGISALTRSDPEGEAADKFR